MRAWIIEPRDALIVRDGRPFGPTPGARATSLTFPFPSTTTGVVRTRAGLDDHGIFRASVEDSLNINVKGPILVELDEDGQISQWMVPAPADALVFEPEPNFKTVDVHPLLPVEVPKNAQTNLPGDLKPVMYQSTNKSKPGDDAPKYWKYSNFEKWLKAEPLQNIQLEQLGHNGPELDSRTHVSINPDTLVAQEGALFQTRGLEFARRVLRKEDKLARRRGPFQLHRLGLAVFTDSSDIKPGIAPMGGERRLAMWRESNQKLPPCPVMDQIKHDEACRVILLTPAHFKKGFSPSWLETQQFGVAPKLEAMALHRYQTVSGWDFSKPKGQPKPTRRLVPAGTVLFLSLKGAAKTAIENWVNHIWMNCVSDDEQSRKDGFGLAALGVWSGKLVPMEVGQ